MYLDLIIVKRVSWRRANILGELGTCTCRQYMKIRQIIFISIFKCALIQNNLT